jgi:CRISPR-associated exonuclease Cas4
VAGREAGDRLADQAEEHYARCRNAYGALMGRIATSLIGTLSAELGEVLAEYEAFKKRAAVFDFDDLLFKCRDVLRNYPVVRTNAGERFSRILVDEFQDTDPVQAEIMFLLCSAEGNQQSWHLRSLRPGQGMQAMPHGDTPLQQERTDLIDDAGTLTNQSIADAV